MRRIAPLLATIMLAAVGLVAGCGSDAPDASGGTAGTVATGTTGTGVADPAAAVSRAYSILQAGSYVSTGTATQDIDASGVAPALRDAIEGQLAAEETTSTTRSRFESPERVAITQDLGSRSQQVVLYDGAVYVSADGERWAEVTGEAAAAFSQASSVGALDPAAFFSGLRAVGTTSIDGAPATRYAGTVNTSAAGGAVQSVIGGLGEAGARLGDAITLRSGTVEIVVDDATGTLARQDLDIRVALDLGALTRAAGEGSATDSGALLLTSTGSERITDVGGDVVVQKPTPSTTVSSVIELGEFLAG